MKPEQFVNEEAYQEYLKEISNLNSIIDQLQIPEPSPYDLEVTAQDEELVLAEQERLDELAAEEAKYQAWYAEEMERRNLHYCHSCGNVTENTHKLCINCQGVLALEESLMDDGEICSNCSEKFPNGTLTSIGLHAYCPACLALYEDKLEDHLGEHPLGD